MRPLLTITLLLAFHQLFAQDCNCGAQFSFVKNYYETNNPAFQKIKANNAEYKNYLLQVKKLTAEISREKSDDRCNIYFEKYVSLLKDHHSGIELSLKRLPINLNAQEAIDSFKATAAYRVFKRVQIDTSSLVSALRLKAREDIEGIYSAGSITVGLYKSKPDTYLGVVVAKHKLLDVGHVLLEFKKRSKDSFDCVYHTGLLALNFQNVYKALEIKNGQIPYIGFSKAGVSDNYDSIPYRFRAIDDSTNYVRLTSFNRHWKEELDSFYTSIDAMIQAKPYLIIDLRDNGGGAEVCYHGLVKYFYTRPLQQDQVDVWVTADNINRYEEINYNPKLVSRMKQSPPSTFIPQIEGDNEDWIMEGTSNPRKVVLLYNKLTASAAEGMITYALQSDKVITLGENSGGFIGYGDVMTTPVPCGKYLLKSTTTQYHNNSRYEFVGIPPMHFLSKKQDGIEAAVKMLAKPD
jgi:hypothetical protein